MKVQEIQIDNKKRYVLIDEENNGPVLPFVRYLKYLGNIGKAENTLRAYCRHLKFYFQLVKEKERGYKDVDLNLLAEFISWLRSPDQSTKVIHLKQVQAKRSERTVNTILACVQVFYDNLMRIMNKI